LSSITVRDLKGTAVRPLSNEGQKATLLFFIMHECPVANSYAPEITRILTEYAGRGIRGYVVYFENDLKPDVASAHARDYGYKSGVLLDRNIASCRRRAPRFHRKRPSWRPPANCCIAAESTTAWRLRQTPGGTDATGLAPGPGCHCGGTASPDSTYPGHWMLYSRKANADPQTQVSKQQASNPDHETESPPLPGTFGANGPVARLCLRRGRVGRGPARSVRPRGNVKNLPEKVTFTEHVAPILFNNCTRCHRPGEAAPFALLNYQDAKKRGKQIAEVTQARFMPPGMPSPAMWKSPMSAV
jgi:hypothetical protein